MKIRAARTADVPAIHALIEAFVPQGILLPRPVEAIERDRENFFVADEDGRIVGCVSLDTYEPFVPKPRDPFDCAQGKHGRQGDPSPVVPKLRDGPQGESAGLAEIRSLAVAAQFQGNGLGARLVAAAVKKARRLSVARVIALTHSLAFFEKQGFVATALGDLPEKIARDCCRCPRHGWCGQQGAIKILRPTCHVEFRFSKLEKRKSAEGPSHSAAIPTPLSP